jgi:hypothetical protein
MPGWLTWMVAMGLLVMEAALLAALGIESWSMQTPLVLTIFVALRRDFLDGALILAGLVIPIEWLAGGAGGYFSLGLVVVFLALHLVRGIIESEWGLSQAILALCAAGVHTLVMAATILLLDYHAGVLEAVLWGAIPGGLAAAVLIWPLGALLSRADSVLDPRSGQNLHFGKS